MRGYRVYVEQALFLKYSNSFLAFRSGACGASNPLVSESSQTSWSKPLLSSRSQQQPDSRSDDRQQITRAREEAEALFRPKQRVVAPSVAAAPPVDAAVRTPRVLSTAAPPVPAAHREPAAPASVSQRVTREIPPSQFARIRAWVTYGMTVPQVAEVCGVGVDEIERVLRKA